MAGPAFEVDTTEMRAAAGQIDSAGSQAAGVIQAFQQKIAALGEPWGTDDLGKAFAGQYLQPSQDGLKALGLLGDGLQAVAKNISTAAGNYDSADGAASQAYRRIAAGPQ